MTVHVVNAENVVVGRLCAKVAKQLLLGDDVKILNAEKAVMSGNFETTLKRYNAKRGMVEKANPENAYKLPRRPDMFLKKMISGMLPKHSQRQQDSLKRLTVYLGVPDEMKLEKSSNLNQKTVADLKGKYFTILDVCKALGWNASNLN